MHRGDYFGAEKIYRRALLTDPNSVATLNNLASLLERGEAEQPSWALAEAEALYKRAIEVNGRRALWNLHLETCEGDHVPSITRVCHDSQVTPGTFEKETKT